MQLLIRFLTHSWLLCWLPCYTQVWRWLAKSFRLLRRVNERYGVMGETQFWVNMFRSHDATTLFLPVRQATQSLMVRLYGGLEASILEERKSFVLFKFKFTRRLRHLGSTKALEVSQLLFWRRETVFLDYSLLRAKSLRGVDSQNDAAHQFARQTSGCHDDS